MTNREGWSAEDIPDLAGKNAIVTGGNSGLGYETSLALASRGAHVVLACRDPSRANAALDAIRAVHPAASVESLPLDLADLSSVRSFAQTILTGSNGLHVLCNNAGVMALPHRTTADGFEMQLGTNHLGHFALTGLLLERLLATEGARVVTVSSTMHRIGRIRWDDLQSERRYGKWAAYGQSKLANLLFAYELGRRLGRGDRPLVSAASHPGYAATNLQATGPRMEGSSFMERATELSNRIFSQSAAMGALPSLYAAVAPDVESGDYFGPGGLMEMAGPPARVGSSARSRDEDDAARLWQVSEELTGVRYAGVAG